MSVYKPQKSPFYQYDFRVANRRFFGSTECTSRREAEKFEAVERDKAKALIKAARQAKSSLLIGDVVVRIWNDEAQYDADPNATWTNLERLVQYFGEATPLSDINHAKTKQIIAWRRGNRVKRRGTPTKEQTEALPLIANATVNRSTTAVLRRLFRFTKAEGAQFDGEPKWSELWLPEPAERVRELQDHEADAFDESMRSDYESFFMFARMCGMRFKECVLLRWSEVNFGTKQIVKIGKRGQRIVFPITEQIRDIIFPLQGNHPEFVFTYLSLINNKHLGRVRGDRYPITYNGTKSVWQSLRVRAKVADFRFHDYRHDFGTKLLRDSGNLKLVQKAMNHRDIKSTLRYAHVLDEDVAAAVERVAKSRKKSRTDILKVS